MKLSAGIARPDLMISSSKLCFKKQLAALILISVSSTLVYFATLHSPFHYDDAHAIVENPYIEDLSRFQETVGIQNILNRSFLLLSFAVNRELGGLEVFGYHLINILLHTAIGILLFYVTAELLQLEPLERRSGLFKLPLLVSLIHIFNPVAVESVTYLSSRSTLLATLFYLLCFYLFIKFLQRREDGQPARKDLPCVVLILFFFFLGCASKEIIVTMPVMAVVYWWMKPEGMKLNEDWPKLILILSPVILYLAYRAVLRGNPFEIYADPSFFTMERSQYFFTQIYVVVFYYLAKFLFPINLNFEPDIKLVSGFTDPAVLAALGVMLALAGVLKVWKSPLAAFALIWALVTLSPTSSFIPLKQLATEHRAYLPGLGISLFMGLVILNLSRLSRAAGPIILGFLILFAILTMDRGLVYKSEIELWRDTARKSPEKLLVHNNLAMAYIKENRVEEARRELRTALRLDPAFTSAYVNLGHLLFQEEKFEEAMKQFDRAIFYQTQDPNAYYNAGNTRLQLGRPMEAIGYLEKAVRMKPASAEYHFALGNAYKEGKLYDDAVK
ncbi:MAG: tetratricopeptide repeat protein, partial [Nitrospinales bacterium]